MPITSVTGYKELQRTFKDIVDKQMPFATALALTKTVTDGKRALDARLTKDIDRPTPFTKRAIAYTKATKTRLEASVFIQPIQSEYLKFQVLGGKRTKSAGKPIFIPSKQTRTNQYGNMPRGKVGKLSARGKTSKSDSLILESYKRGRRGLVYSAAQATYKPSFRFYETAKATFNKVFSGHMQSSLNRALKTAR